MHLVVVHNNRKLVLFVCPIEANLTATGRSVPTNDTWILGGMMTVCSVIVEIALQLEHNAPDRLTRFVLPEVRKNIRAARSAWIRERLKLSKW